MCVGQVSKVLQEIVSKTTIVACLIGDAGIGKSEAVRDCAPKLGMKLVGRYAFEIYRDMFAAGGRLS